MIPTESPDHHEQACDHLDCEAARVGALRLSAFIGNDDILQTAVGAIMSVRDVGYAEAIGWILTFLTGAVVESTIREIASSVDEELRELTDGA